MEEAKTMKTPMSLSIKLDKDEKDKSIDSTMYRGMIESHLSVVKRILRYLKETMDIGLWRSINFSQLQYFRFEGLFGRMGWLPVVTIFEPIFSTLVRAFYSRVTYGLGGSINSTIRSVEIRLSPESICRIFDIPSVGLRVYESKVWPTVSGFEPREAI
ncbi:hypothetical protein AAG906_019205 [Vitis piasezkii]